MSIKYKQKADFQVEVVRWDGNNTEEVEAFVNGAIPDEEKGNMLPHDPEIRVPHCEEPTQAYLIFVQANGMTEKVLPNDYVVREGERDFYVYSPELFVAKYELTEGEEEPEGWYSKNTPEKVFAVQYTGQNLKQVSEFVNSTRVPEVDPDTSEVTFSLMWTFTSSAKPGDYIVKTNYGIRVIDRDEFRHGYQFIIPPKEPEEILEEPPEIEEPEWPVATMSNSPFQTWLKNAEEYNSLFKKSQIYYDKGDK